MINKFEDYLGSLPLTKVVKSRIEEVISFNLKIQKLDIQDIFICELKNDDGSRSYTSLWLFTEKYSIECKNFLTDYNFDVVPHLKRIGYCSIIPKNFDLENADVNSSLKVHFMYNVGSGLGVTGDLIATEQNCLSAFEIYKKYIISNLVE